MGKFMTHEPLAEGLFDRDFSAGRQAYSVWEAELRNSPELLALLTERMEADFLSQRGKLRKSYNALQVEPRSYNI